MDGLPFGCRLGQLLAVLCGRLSVTDCSGGAGPSGESSRAQLLRCTALDVPEARLRTVRGAVRVASAPA